MTEETDENQWQPFNTDVSVDSTITGDRFDYHGANNHNFSVQIGGSTVSHEEYLELTRESAVYPEFIALQYLALGLNDEAGEVAGAVKKHLRGDYGEEELEERVKSEMGDVLWYMTRILDEMDIELDDVRQKNYEKLKQRMETDSIQGDGEDCHSR